MDIGRLLAWCGILVLAAAAAGPAAGAALPDGAAAKLDASLLAAALADSPAPVSAWVSFGDKGEADAADLARRLAEAAAALDPHARARRQRAGVSPLVDYLDLPVHAPYLEALRARGLAPYATSRWFNRTAVRATGTQLAEVAGLACVVGVAPVELAAPMRDVPVDAADVAGAAMAVATLDHGLAEAQLAQIGVPALHDLGYSGAGVRVCVLDDGFNYYDRHVALQGADILATRDFVRGVDDPTDLTEPGYFSHGTKTFSCIAGDEPGRYVGAAPGATFLLGRTEDSSDETWAEMEYWGMGAEWADSAGADVITSSLGYATFHPPEPSYEYADLDGHTTVVSRAAEIAASKGILVVNSAGNEGNKTWHYILAPADVHGDSLVAVGAVDDAGVVAAFSSYGPTADGRVKPDLAARGVATWAVLAADSGYAQYSGTSFSCPLVTGLAACLMEARPAWSPALVIRALRSTASQAEAPDYRVGYGIPDGAAALLWVPDAAAAPDLPPLALSLRLAGPNPITATAPATRVVFGAGAALGPARLSVRDAQGRLVVRDLPGCGNDAAVADGLPLTATWDGRDDSGRPVRAGVYFITLEAGGRRSAVRVVCLR